MLAICPDCRTNIIKSLNAVTCPVCGSEDPNRLPEGLTRSRSLAIEEVDTDILLKMIRRWSIGNVYSSFPGCH